MKLRLGNPTNRHSVNLRCPKCKQTVELSSFVGKERKCTNCDSTINIDALLSIDDSITQTAVTDTPIYHQGDRVGHFEVKELVGKGGFGTVYSAFDLRLERTVALKIPRQSRLSAFQLESFIREAQAAAQLRHPNIVGVHEVGRENDMVYLITDYIEGQTLVEWNKSEQPSEREAAEMIRQISEAMHAAHEKGIIHRDLKPRNILVDLDGKPQITDFGLAKRIEVEGSRTITARGQVVGTPAYMSPEQASGKAQEADQRTDVYSLGVILYELLAGRRPFTGDHDFIIDEVIEGDAPLVRKFNNQVHPDIEAITMKSMATSPDERFQNAREFAAELKRFVEGKPTLTRPPGLASRLMRFARSNAVGLVATLLIFSLGSAAGYFALRTPPVPENKVRIEFAIMPPRADVAIVKVDLDKGHIDYENVYLPEVTDDGCSIDLDPGWYIVEASIPGYGHQEVWRFVPQGVGDINMPEFANCSWERIDDRHIRLADISIKQSSLSESVEVVEGEEMVLCAGGTFEGGSEGVFNMDGTPRRPEAEINMPDYYIGKYEVVFSNYHRVRQRRGYLMSSNHTGEIPPDAPVTNITFLEALEFCEKVGMRLPVFEEYIYAATNAGTTRFPWGDSAAEVDYWKPRLKGKPATDKSLHESPICNLYSSVLEWTQDVELLKGASGSIAMPSSFFEEMTNSRMVVGGPAECLGGLPITKDTLQSPRFFLDVKPTEKSKSVLGFRCAKSVKPRIINRHYAQKKSD